MKNTSNRKHISPFFSGIIMALCLLAGNSAYAKKPLNVLLVTGGCCHNYGFQTDAIKAAIPQGVAVNWTVVNEGGSGTKAIINLYQHAKWAKGYDLVIHNECFADTDDPEYIRKITSAHYKGVNAVVIHCAMHSYRSAKVDDWRAFLGVTSRRHDHQSRYPVKSVLPDNEILKDVPAEWTGPKDELYIIEKLWPNATALATSVSERDGNTYPIAWINTYGKARVFGTTFGHSDEMFKDPVFLKLLGNGILWAAKGKNQPK